MSMPSNIEVTSIGQSMAYVATVNVRVENRYIVADDIAAMSYTIYEHDEIGSVDRRVVPNYEGVFLRVTDCFFDELRPIVRWFDAGGASPLSEVRHRNIFFVVPSKKVGGITVNPFPVVNKYYSIVLRLVFKSDANPAREFTEMVYTIQ